MICSILTCLGWRHGWEQPRPRGQPRYIQFIAQEDRWQRLKQNTKRHHEKPLNHRLPPSARNRGSLEVAALRRWLLSAVDLHAGAGDPCLCELRAEYHHPGLQWIGHWFDCHLFVVMVVVDLLFVAIYLDYLWLFIIVLQSLNINRRDKKKLNQQNNKTHQKPTKKPTTNDPRKPTVPIPWSLKATRSWDVAPTRSDARRRWGLVPGS